MDRAKSYTIISALFLGIANILYWFILPLIFALKYPGGLRGPIMRCMVSPSLEIKVIIYIISGLVILGMILFITGIIISFTKKNWSKLLIIITTILVFMSIPFMFHLVKFFVGSVKNFRYSISSYIGPASISRDMSSWKMFKSQSDKYKIQYPPEMVKTRFYYRNPEETKGLKKGRPYDFTSFVLKENNYSGKKYYPFEVYIGVHLNEEGLSPLAFEINKVKQNQREISNYQVLSKSKINIAGVEGVVDHTLVKKGNDAKRFVRYFIPYKNEMIIIVGLIGKEKEYIPEYHKTFMDMLSTFKFMPKKRK
ncbi:MAG: hypothetical protein K9M00_01825 [Candidatus Omnitrophica bacterium]|nr:hypothetical protein [Candidatus Omnitrophota bacterium]